VTLWRRELMVTSLHLNRLIQFQTSSEISESFWMWLTPGLNKARLHNIIHTSTITFTVFCTSYCIRAFLRTWVGSFDSVKYIYLDALNWYAFVWITILYCSDVDLVLKGCSTFFGNRLILPLPRVKQLSFTIFECIQLIFWFLEEYQ